MKTPLMIGVFLLGLNASSLVTADALETLMPQYQATAENPFSAQRGETFWQTASPTGQKCSQCHGVDIHQSGQHSRTKKIIAPMAPSINPERLTDPAFVEKWFYRNCKAVWQRECTSQEKGDVLLWLSTQ